MAKRIKQVKSFSKHFYYILPKGKDLNDSIEFQKEFLDYVDRIPDNYFYNLVVTSFEYWGNTAWSVVINIYEEMAEQLKE